MVNLVLIEALGAANAPVISVAIWSELEINVFAVDPASTDATLVENEDEASVKDPVMLAAVKLLIKVAFVPKAPDIAVAIWFELLTNVPANSVSAVVNRVDIEALGAVKAPDIGVAI